uniref:Putative salivary secreted protein n=1 Tax=Ornithodoros parkeri TaxID=140564 RepID=A6N9U0_ORNPR|nr:putative salivary secreted protein [Ornithodoros parkeri]
MKISIVLFVAFIIMASCSSFAIGCPCDDGGCSHYTHPQGYISCIEEDCNPVKNGKRTCCKKTA